MLTISFTIACSRYTYDGVILHAHLVCGESHNQRNTTGEVATTIRRYILIDTPNRLHILIKIIIGQFFPEHQIRKWHENV